WRSRSGDGTARSSPASGFRAWLRCDHSVWGADLDWSVCVPGISGYVSHRLKRILKNGLMAYLLTILILLPVAGTLALVGYSFVSSRREEHYRWIALIVTAATFVVSLLLLRGIGASGAEFRFEE